MLSCLGLACLMVGAAAGPARAELGDRLRDLTPEWEAPKTDVLWGFHNLYNARVVEDPDSQYRYKMWLFGWSVADDNPAFPGCDAIFHARSRDLRRWEVYAGPAGWDTTMPPRLWVPVLTAGDKPYDSVHNGDPSVVLRDGVYYMAFSSVGFEHTTAPDGKPATYVTSCIMGATSTDGIHWRKSPAPILIWDKEYANRWEISDVAKSKPPPSYYGSYHRPSLLWDEGRWRLWFDYFLPGTFVSMGYAENRGDFVRPADWRVVRAGEKPLLRDWPNPSVVRAGGRYYCFSDAPGYPAEWGGDTRQISMAGSMDGLNWRVLGHIRPDPGPPGTHVPEAFVHTDASGTWLYVFYAWKPGGQPWDFRYKSIRVMRRLLGRRGERGTAVPPATPLLGEPVPPDPL